MVKDSSDRNGAENGEKRWEREDIEILRLVVLLVSVNPSEERLEWVFNEVRTLAKMAKERENEG